MVAAKQGLARFALDQSELLQFAMHLMDIADDCLRKSNKDTDDVESELGDVMGKIRAIDEEEEART